MFKPRPCGCKGIRTCLICEEEFGIKISPNDNTNSNKGLTVTSSLDIQNCFEFCHLCESQAWRGSNVASQHDHHIGESIEYPGVLMIPEFLSKEEENLMINGCDSLVWDLSQSGRRKQNFGPKTNFKKMKINGKSFEGFPKFTEFAQEKLRSVSILKDFQTIEQCAIEYRPETGACIDPHIDDCWVWGENVISVNLISDSVLTMTKYRGGVEKYNLRYHKLHNHREYSPQLEDQTDSNSKDSAGFPIVRIPMPSRSLLVLYGPARYEWEHCILRSDINERRICMAYREFTSPYLQGGELYDEIGRDVCDRAKRFW